MSTDSVLIVEDTPVNLKVVTFVMRRAGFDVRTATSAEEALELLEHFCPRVVLTDIQLPGMGGLELIKRLKSDPGKRNTIVLALTAFAMRSDEQTAFEAGCDGFITKPIDTRTFPNLIRQYIATGRGAASNSAPSVIPEADGPAFSLSNIQQMFVTEGRLQTERFINALNTVVDYSELRIAAHRWVGAAGQIGYLEIAKKARDLEVIVQQSGPDSMALVREALDQLMELFSTAFETGGRLPPAAMADGRRATHTIGGSRHQRDNAT
jgi:two-component system cell cycle response regulator DivK